ncbi:NnrS family protein [Pelagicoccus sp. SDUM812002]|uniref:NnrS family protein n=1 Tax=Pelagicoccus sp. SDUM812002 TaxID=3041266 RepID=UPI00280FC423|nr:NnrS family protein [Pelagicoccus sp. SDUM812002]MDQ8184610.1 NnrS family protein [Pelagicoccus sp. SDUM812002]
MKEPQPSKESPQPRFCDLAHAEPFRIFFPLGMTLGIVGVALWPLFELGIVTSYPLDTHIRLMCYGFLGCFVIGFLLTAGPRLLSCPGPTRLLIHLQLGLSLAASLLSFLNPSLADSAFLLQLATLFAAASYGFAKRNDLPPPGFLLGLAGLISAAVGSAFLLQLSLGNGGATSYALSRILLFQAFPALPLVGIGAFFFPKLTGAENNPQDFPESVRPSLPWLKRAAWALATIVLFLISIPLELRGQSGIAYSLRAVACGLYIVFETPVFKPSKAPSSQRLHLVLCSLSLIASFLLVAFYPHLRTAALHIFFIVGLTGSILLVSTRVVFGHSGSVQLARSSVKPLLLGIALLIVGSISRLLMDTTPGSRIIDLYTTAALWLTVALAWLALVAPKTRTPDPDDTPCSH